MKNQQFYVKTARLAVPIMMQNMITIGVNMADNIMVGSLGENALSAVALANQFINIYQFSCMGLGQGASIMTSRFWGMKNEKALNRQLRSQRGYVWYLEFCLRLLHGVSRKL